jgi:hypothetical protein
MRRVVDCALVLVAVLACGSKASGVHGPGVPPEEMAFEPGSDASLGAKHGGAKEAEAGSADQTGGWSATVDVVSGEDRVSEFRWGPDGGLLFLSQDGWKIYEGGEARLLHGEELKLARAAAMRPWESASYKWKVGFDLFRSEVSLKCEDLSGETAARLEVCLRKYPTRCNVYVFTRQGDLPFPWEEAEAPAGLEALDLVAFPKKTRMILGRGEFLVVFDLVQMPAGPEPAPAKTGIDPCEDYQPVLAIDTFAGHERLGDLVAYTDQIAGTPYTVDGTGYLFPGEGGVWLARFGHDVDPVLVVPLDVAAASVAWSPYQERIAILDDEDRLLVARVERPGLTPVTVEETEIR